MSRRGGADRLSSAPAAYARQQPLCPHSRMHMLQRRVHQLMMPPKALLPAHRDEAIDLVGLVGRLAVLEVEQAAALEHEEALLPRLAPVTALREGGPQQDARQPLPGSMASSSGTCHAHTAHPTCLQEVARLLGRVEEA